MDNDKRFEDNALQRIEAQRENSERGEEAAAESAGRIGRRRIRMRIIGEKGGECMGAGQSAHQRGGKFETFSSKLIKSK